MEPTRTVRYRFDDKAWQVSLDAIPVSTGEWDPAYDGERVYAAACGLVESHLARHGDLSSGHVVLEDESGTVLKEQHFGS